MVSQHCGIVNADIFMATVVLNHDHHICHFTGLPGSTKSCFEKPAFRLWKAFNISPLLDKSSSRMRHTIMPFRISIISQPCKRQALQCTELLRTGLTCPLGILAASHLKQARQEKNGVHKQKKCIALDISRNFPSPSWEISSTLAN